MSAACTFRFISWTSLSFGLISVLYFFSLAMALPIWCTALLALAGSAGLGFWLFRNSSPDEAMYGRHLLSPLILLAGLTLLMLNSFPVMEKRGGWDAWAIWNHRASMLEDPQRWMRAFNPDGNEHPDYPLCLPGGIAILNRLFPGLETDAASIGIAWATTLSIVLLLFGTLSKQKPWTGAALMLLLATDATFLKIGLSQYDDTLLALYFLTACIAYHRIDKDRRAAVVCGAALGLCFWTKNEGGILALLSSLFIGPRLFACGKWNPFLAGLLPMIAVWVFFKWAYAPSGDMFNDSATIWLEKLADAQRYEILWTILRDTMAQSYGIPTLLMLAYVVMQVRTRRTPGADFMLICTATLAYCSIYLVTPNDLEWHLRTSLIRLLHQLMPATVFVCVTELSRLRFQLADEPAH